MTEIFEQVAAKAIADHQAAVGKVHRVVTVIGYVAGTDEQVDLSLDPPVRFIVDDAKPEHGVLHDTGTHLDPYWDLTPCNPADPQIAHLRSMYTYGPSYDLKTGEKEVTWGCIPESQIPNQRLRKRLYYKWQEFRYAVSIFWRKNTFLKRLRRAV